MIAVTEERQVTVPPPPRRAPKVARVVRGIKAFLLTLYAVAFWYSVDHWGFPIDRELILLWLLGAMAIASLGRRWRELVKLVLEWIPLALVLIFYDYSRGFATTVNLPLHITPQITLDKIIGFGTVPTVWLQEHLLNPNHVSWWEVIPSLCYVSHFVASYALLAWLWVRDRARWFQYTCRFVTLSFVGVATYILLPAAPPWYASDYGYLPYTYRAVGRGWSKLHLGIANSLFDEGSRAVNVTAALPSLHVAFATLFSAILWPKANKYVRVLLVLYPLLMGFTLVLDAEHYVVDLLLGWLYVWGVLVVWKRIDRRLAARKARRRASGVEPGPPGPDEGGAADGAGPQRPKPSIDPAGEEWPGALDLDHEPDTVAAPT
jgi:membrane-associated phospholipid phosphatase